ncbi:hypothetical protein LTR08_003639 [Meristemomyces frigidus]|nr:hypothetical protein LTR08_003639 [Meristemomyces frigidus]
MLIVRQPKPQLSVPRPASRVAQLPSIYRSFHASRRWCADEQRAGAAQAEASPAEAETSGETVTTEPSAAEEQIKADTFAASDAVSESSGTTSAPIEQPDAATDASHADHTETHVSEDSSSSPSMLDRAQDLASSAAQTVQAAASNTVRTARDTFDQPGTRRDRSDRSTAIPPRVPRADSAPRQPSRILYIGNLFFEVTAPQLESEFSQYGELANSRIVTDTRGLSKGFGYIEFTTQEAADQAVRALDQKVFQGRRLAVQYHVRRDQARTESGKGAARGFQSASEPSKTLFVGNMSYQMSDRDLNDLFREVRNVLDVRVAIDRRSGQPRGFAHADFVDVESARVAKEMLERKVVYGRSLRVDYSAGDRTGGAKESV